LTDTGKCVRVKIKKMLRNESDYMEYLLGFDQKNEWISTENGFVSYPLGSAVLMFVSNDPPESHPLLAAFHGDESFREHLRQCVEYVLVAVDERSAIERLYTYFDSNPEFLRYNTSKAKRLFRKGDHGLESHIFMVAEELAPLLFEELEEMAEAGLHVRTCEYCGKYFVPFSSRTLYCDRLVGETGKTCKELAAREKYEQKIAEDEGRALFNRRCKAYAMRVHRDPTRFSEEEYHAWRDYAELSLKAYMQGKLSLELLKMVLELPEK